jgi:YbbR domain-containing protein
MKNMLLENFFLKVLTLLLAMTVWYYVNTVISPSVVRTVTIPIRVTNLPPATWIDPLPTECQIKIKGARKDIISRLYNGSIYAYVNLSMALPNIRTKIKVDISGTENMVIEFQSPNFVEVKPLLLTSRKLPLLLTTKGKLKDGYYLKKLDLTPTEVTITGPDKLIRDFTHQTVTVELTNHSADFESKIALFTKQHQEIPGFDAEINEATVRGTINPWPARKVSIIPVTTGKVAPGFEVSSITTVPPEVFVKGLPELVSLIKNVNTLPVNIDNLKTSMSQKTELQLEATGDVFLEKTTVQLTIAINKIISNREFHNTRPLILKDESTEVTFSPSIFTLKLTGPALTINQLPDKNLTVTIDSRGQQTGEVELPLALKPPLSDIELTPRKIKVKITKIPTKE